MPTMPELYPAEALTAQHRYLKVRVRRIGDTIHIDNTHGKTLESIDVGAVEPIVVSGWWQFGDNVMLQARAMGGCDCGGSQIL